MKNKIKYFIAVVSFLASVHYLDSSMNITGTLSHIFNSATAQDSAVFNVQDATVRGILASSGTTTIGDAIGDLFTVNAGSMVLTGATTIYAATDGLVLYNEANAGGKLYVDADGNMDLLFTSAPAETDAPGWVTVSSMSLNVGVKSIYLKVLCLNSQDGTGENASVRLSIRQKWSNAAGNTGANPGLTMQVCDARASLANERSRDWNMVFVPISTDSLRSFEYQCLNEDGVGTTVICDGYLAGVVK